jgi:glycosyltransferase involved in cell wall biosynthesis
MTPVVSVIIPTYNYAHFLPGALESVLSQTVSDLEVIVVDDGSTDNTADVMRPYLADPRVRFQPIPHAGVSAAKNTGIRLSRAPLVGFLDSDDLWLPTKLARQLALFQADPELGVAYTRRLLINPAGQAVFYQQPVFHRGMILEPLFQTNFVCQSSALVRRAVLDDVGVFDERYPPVEDYDLWLRVAARYRFDYVDEPLVKYRVGHASLGARTENRLVIALEVMQRFLEKEQGPELIRAPVIRRARAETYFHLSLSRRNRSLWAALKFNLQALAQAPGYLPAWKGLASLALPERGRRLARRLLGKPVDWSIRVPVASESQAVG